MGHDITAFNNDGRDLAYLRVGTFDRLKAHLIYEALDSHDCDGGVSGDGSEREFTSEQMKIALAKLKYIAGEDKEIIMQEVFSCNSNQAIKDGLIMFGSIFGTDHILPEKYTSEEIKSAVYEVEEFLMQCQGQSVRIDFR